MTKTRAGSSPRIPLLIRALALTGLLGAASASGMMEELSDEGMAAVSGQSLFSAISIAPGVAGATGGANPNDKVGFYRFGLEGSLAINANIDKLRLGCDGTSAFTGLGVGTCDISIDDVRLHGVGTDSVANSNSGLPTDFLLNQPFFEFAIKNPDNPATRQIVGMRFGAASALGAISIGENPDVENVNDDSGLNSLSGDLVLNIRNAQLNNLYACITGLCIVPVGPLQAFIDESFSQTVSVKRASKLDDLGPLTAVVSGVFGINADILNGLKITNAHLIDQPLDNIHRIDIKSPCPTPVTAACLASPTPTKDFYISMQGQDISWQKPSTGNFDGILAQKGWWLSVPQAVFQDLVVTDHIEVTLAEVLGGLVGRRVELSGVDLGQRPTDNCWGNSKFC